MKSLILALLCTAVGFSASADDLKPKKVNDEGTKAQISVYLDADGKAISEKEANKMWRKKAHYYFTDGCGNRMDVWVSCGSCSDTSLYQTAYNYASDHTDWWGCFEGGRPWMGGFLSHFK